MCAIKLLTHDSALQPDIGATATKTRSIPHYRHSNPDAKHQQN